MKIGQKVKIKDTGELGTIEGIDGNIIQVKTQIGKIIPVETQKLILITFFEWILQKLTSWITKK